MNINQPFLIELGFVLAFGSLALWIAIYLIEQPVLARRATVAAILLWMLFWIFRLYWVSKVIYGDPL